MYYVVMCGGLSLPNGQISYDPDLMTGQYPVGTTASLRCNSGCQIRRI